MTTSIDAQRQQLQSRLDELTSRRDAIHKDVAHKSRPQEESGEDRAASNNNDEVLGDLDLAARDEIEQITLALQRISDGTYTQCTSCGEPINPERLQALPEASLCISCATD